MALIQVTQRDEKEDGWTFVVEVGINSAEKIGYLVKVEKEYWEALTKGRYPPELLVRRSFMFLLSREAKSSILRNFNLREIQGYFPSYEDEMRSIFKVS